MRIAYNNLLDQLPSAQVVPLTETVLYEAVNIQDQRLEGTQWWTTSPTSQTIIFGASTDTIVGGNIGLVTGSSVTNLVLSSENLTSGDWVVSSSGVTTAQTIIGVPAYAVTASGTATSYLSSTADLGFAATAGTVTVVARKGADEGSLILIRDVDDGLAVRANLTITFATKNLTYAVGSEAMPPEWIDDDTVRVFLTPDLTTLVPGNDNRLWLYARINGGSGATADSVIYSAPMAIDNTYPVPYVATSRTAIDTSYAFRLPPSGKFIVDFEVKPFFPFDVSGSRRLWQWKIDATHWLLFSYNQTPDSVQLQWSDGGTFRTINVGSAFDSGTAQTINQSIRYCASIDLASAVQTGSRVFSIPRSQGSFEESNDWGDVPDVLTSSTFTTLEVATDSGSDRADAIFRNFRTRGGVFTSAQTITTETELDAALADHELLFDKTYQNQFNFDTVAIMGHNISEGAAITFQANDFNEWNYTDGSSSSIIQHTLAWDDETILKMITKTKKTYAKFTINDPNNDAAQLKIGRIWLGPYIDIDPSSLDDFKVVKKRSDRNQYSRNRNKWSDVGVGWRRFELTFPRSGTTMIEKIQTMYDFSGNHSSMIFMNFDTLKDYKIVLPVYCSIDGDVTFGHRGRQKYVYSLNLEEDR